MKNTISIWVGLGCIIICFAQVSHAIEDHPYSYHPTVESEKFLGVADREINCAGIDAIDLGIDSANHQSFKSLDGKSHVLVKRMFFTREQIASFLKMEKHKSMILVHVAKFAANTFDMTKFKPFLESLGYKRILVLRDSAFFPMPIELDETMNDPSIEQKPRI
jgi:hypothetical protein